MSTAIAQTVRVPLTGVNLLDPDAYGRQGPPHELFREVRADRPISWHELPGGDGLWAITKHKDVFTVGIDSKTYVSSRGVIMRRFTEEEFEPQKGMLIHMDPPVHTRFRRLLSLAFSAKQLRRMEEHVRGIAREIVDAVAARGRCDLVADVACELPLRVIVELIGLPQEDRHKVLDWSNRMIGFDDPEYQTDPMVGQMAAAELFMYANALAEQRLAEPKDDLTSLLMHAEVDGARLTVSDYNAFFLLLGVAGNETTRNLISGGMLALLQHPEQHRRLVADRERLLPTAVEEMLRWVTPVNHFTRTVTRDVELSGVPLREGDRVCLFYASANRDEAVFERPQEFDVGRTPNEHLAFGIGTHFCLGANLARLEIAIMFDELLKRLPDIELDGEPERLRSNFINGIKRMPIRYTPR